MKKCILALFFAAISISCITLKAQVLNDTVDLYQVETSDGNQFIGSIVSENDETINLNTEKFGLLVIRKGDVTKLTKLSATDFSAGELRPENTQSSRYFWSPNGFGLKKGEGYYQNIWIMFNQVSFGITNNFSMGVGIVPLFLFGSDAASLSPVWVVPKVSIPIKKDKFNIGAGLLAGSFGFQEDGEFGIAYGLGTLGNRNNNFTFGLGYGFANGDWANRPVLTMGFMARTGPRGYLLSENYYISSGGSSVVLFSMGGRTLLRSVGIDYGLIIPITAEVDFIAIPWLGITVPIRNKKLLIAK